MRIFVTGTGRCGSVTFSKACQHITNFTSAHESDWQNACPMDINYPDNHIEVSPHLAYFIPYLRNKYPDAKWVHLIRTDVNNCIESLASVCNKSMMSFGYQWYGIGDDFLCPKDASESLHKRKARYNADKFYHATNHLCAALLAPMQAFNKSMPFGLEGFVIDWPEFWQWIEAEGDYEKALAEFKIKHNAGRK